MAAPSVAAMLAAGTGLLALALVVVLRPVVSHTTTTAHEGGHALFVVMLGGRLHGVRVDRDNSGLTTYSGIRGLDRFLVALAGYLAPSMFGLLGAALLVSGEAAAVLVMSLVLLGLLLLTIRNVFGALVVSALVGLVWWTLSDGSTGLQEIVAFTWVWVLLISGVVDVLGLRGIRRAMRQAGDRDRSSDAYQLGRMTLLPGALWVLFFLLATLAALVLGGSMLLGVGP
jgi:hypothetical protein